MVSFRRKCANCGDNRDFPLSISKRFGETEKIPQGTIENNIAEEGRYTITMRHPEYQFAGTGFCPNCDHPAFIVFTMSSVYLKEEFGINGVPRDDFFQKQRGDLNQFSNPESFTHFPPND